MVWERLDELVQWRPCPAASCGLHRPVCLWRLVERGTPPGGTGPGRLRFAIVRAGRTAPPRYRAAVPTMAEGLADCTGSLAGPWVASRMAARQELLAAVAWCLPSREVLP